MKSQVRKTASDDGGDFGVKGLNPEIVERLKVAIRDAGGNKAVADASGVPLSTLNGALAGKNQPRATAMAAIAAATGKSLDWLMVLKEVSESRVFQAQSQSLGVHFHNVPRLSFSASSGHGAMIVEEGDGFVPIRAELLDRLGLRLQWTRVLDASGDGMAPTILDGDQLVVDISPDAQSRIIDNRIYVFTVGDESFVKRLRREPGRLIMLADNRENFPEREVPQEESFAMIGRVRWVGHEL